MEKTISARQLALIAFVSAMSLKLTALPSVLFQKIKTDSVFVILFFYVIDFFSFLAIYYVLKRNQDISFYQFLNKSFGKVITKIIFLSIFIFFFFKMLLLTSGSYDYSKEVIFQEAPLYLFVFVLLISSGSLYLFKAKSFGRTVEFLYPIIAFLSIAFLIVACVTSKIYDIRPFLNIDSSLFFKTAFNHLFVSGDYIFMLLFMGKIKFKNDKSDRKTLLGHIILSILIVLAFYYLFNSLFKYTGFLHHDAISEIVQFLPLPTVLGNFDWVTITLMMLLFLLDGGLFTFCMCDSLRYTVKSEKFKIPNDRKWILVFAYALILIFLYFVFKTFGDIKIFGADYLKYLSVFVFAIPFIIFLIEFIKAKIKPRRKINEKNL